jgi:hypothetical protein
MHEETGAARLRDTGSSHLWTFLCTNDNDEIPSTALIPSVETPTRQLEERILPAHSMVQVPLTLRASPQTPRTRVA